ncbi:HDOD domain-containing protein [Uliginosibacterium sp. 31-16]|uniref:EAL and HDOD domain-containing protein n=1 Tax=Uliginosibacterium sp. 31-16 TaxID=3068315 RepID=UPI00273EA68C|nr:HDOD domain-containing protein [Uliginosibacterium sp. 31-16]MDP5238977.1 HDOD domain-containing protein [Uliginosibacterium sp. 31-16]
MFGKLITAFNRWFSDAPAGKPLRARISTLHAGESAQNMDFPDGIPESLAASRSEGDAATDAQPEPVLVHREVLDEALGVSGIEFFVRGELRDKIAAHRSSMRRFLDSMLIDQLASLRGSPLRQRQAWVQLAETSLLRLGTGKLPARACVLLWPEDSQRRANPDTREAIVTMQDAGHEVWLDDAIGSPWFASLADLADGATLRLAMRTPLEVAELLKGARDLYAGLRLGAWDVGTLDDYEMARRLRCTRFSGSFVTRREDWSGRELSPQMLSVASLINQIREETNFRAVAQVLRQDMAMSYRLLRYVNAAAQGLSQPISSIEQGLLILGQAQLDRWLILLLLSGGELGDTALTEVALTRARFLELVGSYRLPPEQCEKLFVLGLFSMLDVALKVPLETAVKPLRLAEPLNAALLRREGPYGMYLALADACERGIATEIGKYALMLGLTTSKVSVRQIEAINWVARISAEPALRAAQ